jgi:hypothetical protein
MAWIREVYLGIFVLFFRIGQNSWSYTSNVAKAVAGITWLHLMLLIGLIAWLYFFSGDKLLLAIPRPAFYILFGILTLLNYYTLVTRGVGTRFEAQFASFGHRHRVLLLATSLAIIVCTFGFAIFSGYYVHAHGPLRP